MMLRKKRKVEIHRLFGIELDDCSDISNLKDGEVKMIIKDEDNILFIRRKGDEIYLCFVKKEGIFKKKIKAENMKLSLGGE